MLKPFSPLRVLIACALFGVLTTAYGYVRKGLPLRSLLSLDVIAEMVLAGVLFGLVMWLVTVIHQALKRKPQA